MNFILLLTLALTGFALTFHLPAEFHTCSLSDANFKECLRSSVEDAIGKLANGNKELGLIPLEPLRIEQISVGQVPGSSVNIDQKFTNIKLYGLSVSKINTFNVNFDNCNIYAEVFTPVLRTEADFEMKGQLLFFPINAKGPSNVTLTNLMTIHNISCEMYEKKGKTRVRLINYNITTKPEKIHYKFDNALMGGNSLLNEQIHQTINQNSIAIYEEVRPATEESYGLVFKEIGNRIFTKIPLEEIFRDYKQTVAIGNTR